ncbi:MAG: hypothetical protein SFX73_16135 [Kofleriaceae bacterium]|nr:hypothetical protein [Kofleriaceae bacterium]
MSHAHTFVALLALATAAPAHAEGDPSSVKAAYLSLRDGGCKVDTLGSPIAVRALRNVPYALNGKIFKSAELTYLYEHDGDWYKPTDANADVADADRACVRALDAQEKALRKRVAIKPAIEQAITRHPGAVLDMARLVMADFKKITQAEKTAGASRLWTLEFKAGGGAASVQIECSVPAAEAKAKPPVWVGLVCNVLAAG